MSLTQLKELQPGALTVQFSPIADCKQRRATGGITVLANCLNRLFEMLVREISVDALSGRPA